MAKKHENKTVEIPAHIKEFNTIAGSVLAQLYEAFPQSTDVDKQAVAAAVGVDPANFLTATLPSGRSFNVMLAYTIVWLNDEGFSRSFGGHPAERVVLASRGLGALNGPSNLEGLTVGSSLTQAAGRGHIDGSAIGDLIGGTIGGFYKSMGS